MELPTHHILMGTQISEVSKNVNNKWEGRQKLSREGLSAGRSGLWFYIE